MIETRFVWTGSGLSRSSRFGDLVRQAVMVVDGADRGLGVGDRHGADQGDEQQGTGQLDGDQVIGVERLAQAGDVGLRLAVGVVELRVGRSAAGDRPRDDGRFRRSTEVRQSRTAAWQPASSPRAVGAGARCRRA